MNSYLGGFGTAKRGRRSKRMFAGIVVAIILLLLAVMLIGLIAGTDNERSREISAAIAENTQLKQTIYELQTQIDSLSAELEEFKTKIPQEVIESYLFVASDDVAQYPESPRAELER